MNLRTSLYNNHLGLGAKIAPFAGFDMPIQYSSVKEETKAVREDCGVFDVSHMGEFQIDGPETFKFLNFLLTNEIEAPEVGKAIYSPMCNEDGFVIDDLIVYKLEPNKALLCVNAANLQKDWDWILEKSSEFQVQLNNLSDNTSLIALQGPNAQNHLNKIGFKNLHEYTYYSVKEEDNLILARTGYTGEDGFEIFGNHEHIAQIWTKLISNGVKPCGLAARDVLRLEVCYPLYGNELNDSSTPYESGLAWTIKKEKENFIGKQSLSSKGPRFKLIKLSLDKGIPRQNYKVENESGLEIGMITSGTHSVTLNKGIALAKIDKNIDLKSTKLYINIRNKKYLANLHNKQFVVGGHK